jgi:hypothetical protein
LLEGARLTFVVNGPHRTIRYFVIFMKSSIIRTGLLFFGILLGVLCLELFLQLCHLYAVSARQSRPPSGQGGLRILCLGESTTESGGWENPASWPKQLEAKLRSTISPDITVYNRGVVGTNSKKILNTLPKLLEEVHPHLVLTMIGINDDLNVLIYEAEVQSFASSAAAHSRLYRFIRMLIRSHQATSDPLTQPAPSELRELQRRRNAAQTAGDRLALILALEQLAEKDPSTPLYYYGFLQNMLFSPLSSQDIAKAAMIITGRPQTIPLSKDSLQALAPLVDQSPLDPLAKLQIQVEVLRGQGDTLGIASLLMIQSQPILNIYSQAQLCKLRVSQQTSTDELSCYQELLRRVEGHPVLRRAIGLHLVQSNSFKLASLFLMPEDEEQLAREDTRSRGVVIRQKALTLWMSGEHQEANRLFQIDDTYRQSYPAKMTVTNYPSIVNQIKQSGGRVVAIQYPMLATSSLRALLADSPPDGYIDQERFFKEQVIKHGYTTIFSDAFAGSFGHTRHLGNRLMAENVFTQLVPILSKYFPEWGKSGRTPPNTERPD